MALGNFFSMYLKSDGTVWAAGQNNKGQLGNGSGKNEKSFTKVSDGATAVAAGEDFSMVVKTDGSLWAAGKNQPSDPAHPIHLECACVCTCV